MYRMAPVSNLSSMVRIAYPQHPVSAIWYVSHNLSAASYLSYMVRIAWPQYPTSPILTKCYHCYASPDAKYSIAGWLKRCFMSTETVGLLGTGAQDVELDFHTAPEL